MRGEPPNFQGFPKKGPEYGFDFDYKYWQSFSAIWSRLCFGYEHRFGNSRCSKKNKCIGLKFARFKLSPFTFCHFISLFAQRPTFWDNWQWLEILMSQSHKEKISTIWLIFSRSSTQLKICRWHSSKRVYSTLSCEANRCQDFQTNFFVFSITCS